MGAVLRVVGEFLLTVLVEGIIEFLGWRKCLLILGVVILGLVILYVAVPEFAAMFA